MYKSSPFLESLCPVPQAKWQSDSLQMSGGSIPMATALVQEHRSSVLYSVVSSHTGSAAAGSPFPFPSSRVQAACAVPQSSPGGARRRRSARSGARRDAAAAHAVTVSRGGASNPLTWRKGRTPRETVLPLGSEFQRLLGWGCVTLVRGVRYQRLKPWRGSALGRGPANPRTSPARRSAAAAHRPRLPGHSRRRTRRPGPRGLHHLPSAPLWRKFSNLGTAWSV